MEHNPLMQFEDDTTMTYSDLKFDKNKDNSYITIYFETPNEKLGFCSMDIDYPNGTPRNVKGYTEEDMDFLLKHYNKMAPIAFEESVSNSTEPKARKECIYA